jgi:DNA replication protein DnaC
LGGGAESKTQEKFCQFTLLCAVRHETNRTFVAFLDHIFAGETKIRKRRPEHCHGFLQARLTRLTRHAHFPFLKTTDDFNFTYQSSLRLHMLGSALTPNFKPKDSLIFAGKAGCQACPT